MKLETLIRRTLDEWSTEARVPPGLADRAVRRAGRQRVRTLALAAGSAALTTATVLTGVTVGTGGGPDPRPAVRPVPADTALHADPRRSPPLRLVAAGRIAMSAYYVPRGAPPEGNAVRRSWYLYDPASGGYRATPWAQVDVAPGLRRAAVLEGPLPAARVGVLDMATQKVVRWIPLARRAGGLAWSPDGRRLAVTTYDRDPDQIGPPGTPGRTGFYLVDPRSGRAVFHALPPDADNLNVRQDLGWSRTGALLWSPTTRVPAKKFYDLAGEPRPAPAHEADGQEAAGLSPNGRYLATPGSGPGPSTAVVDVVTGRTVGVQPVEQLSVWADDTHLIAVACDPKKCTGRGEFRNRLVLVGLDGRTVTPLTGYQVSDRPGAWRPLFTRR